ncbi:MAG TPA: cytochrome c [Pirellulales bacterium]
MKRFVIQSAFACPLAAATLLFAPSFASAGKPYRSSVAVAPIVEPIQLVPLVAFFRVGDAARETALREEAYREGYARGRAEAQASTQTPSPLASAPTSPTSSTGIAAPLPGERISQVDAVLRRACVRCHAGERAAGGLDLTNAQTIATKRAAIFKAAYTGRMPPSGPPVGDEDVRILLDYLISDESSESR